MLYLCLVYNHESVSDESAMCELEFQIDEMRMNGQCLVAHDLEPASEVAVLRVRDGVSAVTGQRETDDRRQLSRFVLLEARDLNDAIRMASKFPPARSGYIEVRPVRPVRSCGGD